MTGKIIHIVGNPFQGYRLEFKQNYNYTDIVKAYDKIILGQVNDWNVIDMLNNVIEGIKTIAQDATKNVAI